MTFKEFTLHWQDAFAEADRSGFGLAEFVLEKAASPGRLEKILCARNLRDILPPPGGEVTPDIFKGRQRSIDRWRAGLLKHRGTGPVTSANQNPEEIGRAAIQLLIALITHDEIGIPKICRAPLM